MADEEKTSTEDLAAAAETIESMTVTAASILYKLGKYEEAYEAFSGIEKLDDPDGMLCFELCKCRLNKAKYEETAAGIKKAITRAKKTLSEEGHASFVYEVIGQTADVAVFWKQVFVLGLQQNVEQQNAALARAQRAQAIGIDPGHILSTMNSARSDLEINRIQITSMMRKVDEMLSKSCKNAVLSITNPAQLELKLEKLQGKTFYESLKEVLRGLKEGMQEKADERNFESCLSHLENLKNEAARKKREEEEKVRKERAEKYWSEHPDQKAELENKITSARSELTEAENERAECEKKVRELTKRLDEKQPSEIAADEKKKQVIELVSQVKALGFFKNKERKALYIEIEGLQGVIESLKKDAESEKEKHTEKIDALLKEANSALNKAKNRKQKLLDEIDKHEHRLAYPHSRK